MQELQKSLKVVKQDSRAEGDADAHVCCRLAMEAVHRGAALTIGAPPRNGLWDCSAPDGLPSRVCSIVGRPARSQRCDRHELGLTNLQHDVTFIFSGDGAAQGCMCWSIWSEQNLKSEILPARKTLPRSGFQWGRAVKARQSFAYTNHT